MQQRQQQQQQLIATVLGQLKAIGAFHHDSDACAEKALNVWVSFLIVYLFPLARLKRLLSFNVAYFQASTLARNYRSLLLGSLA